MDIPASGVVPIEQMVGDDETDTALLRRMSVDAKNYLEAFDWCKVARPEYWGGGIGSIFSLFLFQIEPTAKDVDRWLWVIVGDIPPLYLVLDECRSPKQAADMYLALMGDWVRLARKGQSSPDLPAAGVEPTPEQAEALERRLAYTRANIKPFLNG